jgi:hypothetical protein
MGVVDPHHPLRMAGPDRVTPWFGRSKALKVNVTYSHLVKSRGKLTLRKTRLPGRCHRANVNQQADVRIF